MDTWFWTKKKNYTMGKKFLFNKWFWFYWMSVYRRIQIDLYLSACTKFRINDLNMNLDKMNMIEDKVWKRLAYIETWNNFLNRTSIAQTLRIIGTSWNWKASVRQRTLSIGQNGNLQNGRRSSPTTHLIEDSYIKYIKN